MTVGIVSGLGRGRDQFGRLCWANKANPPEVFYRERASFPYVNRWRASGVVHAVLVPAMRRPIPFPKLLEPTSKPRTGLFDRSHCGSPGKYVALDWSHHTAVRWGAT